MKTPPPTSPKTIYQPRLRCPKCGRGDRIVFRTGGRRLANGDTLKYPRCDHADCGFQDWRVVVTDDFSKIRPLQVSSLREQQTI